MNIPRLIRSLLEQPGKTQWLTFLTLTATLLTLSIWQQQHSLSQKQRALDADIIRLKASNTLLKNKLDIYQQSRQPTARLSNDQIADLFDQLTRDGTTQVISLDFFEETNNKGTDLVRVKAELLTSMPDLFALVDIRLGRSLFIESLTLRRQDAANIHLLLELVQTAS